MHIMNGDIEQPGQPGASTLQEYPWSVEIHGKQQHVGKAFGKWHEEHADTTVLGPLLLLRGMGIAGLEDVSGLEAIPRLHTLDLSENELDSVDGLSSMPWAPGLVELDLRGNHLAALPDLTTFTSLRRIDLGENAIGELDISMLPDAIEQVNLGGNSLDDGFLVRPRSLPGLVVLDLSGNRLTKLDGSWFGRFARLGALDLSRNAIGEFQHLEALPGTLERLYLHGNRVTGVGPLCAIGHLGELKLLSLHDNSIGSFPPVGFPRMPSLRFVSLDGNPIAGLAEGKRATNGLPSYIMHGKNLHDVELGIRLQQQPQVVPTGDVHRADKEEIFIGVEYKGIIHPAKITWDLGNDDTYYDHEYDRIDSITLDLKGLGIEDITQVHGLETITRLDEIYLDNNKIDNLDWLARMKWKGTVEKIFIMNNQIQKVRDLATIGLNDQHIMISLKGNPIREIDPENEKNESLWIFKGK